MFHAAQYVKLSEYEALRSDLQRIREAITEIDPSVTVEREENQAGLGSFADD